MGRHGRRGARSGSTGSTTGLTTAGPRADPNRPFDPRTAARPFIPRRSPRLFIIVRVPAPPPRPHTAVRQLMHCHHARPIPMLYRHQSASQQRSALGAESTTTMSIAASHAPTAPRIPPSWQAITNSHHAPLHGIGTILQTFQLTASTMNAYSRWPHTATIERRVCRI